MHIKIREMARTILWILAVVFVMGAMVIALRNETTPAYQVIVVDGHQYMQTRDGRVMHLFSCPNPVCVERLLEGRKPVERGEAVPAPKPKQDAPQQKSLIIED